MDCRVASSTCQLASCHKFIFYSRQEVRFLQTRSPTAVATLSDFPFCQEVYFLVLPNFLFCGTTPTPISRLKTFCQLCDFSFMLNAFFQNATFPPFDVVEHTYDQNLSSRRVLRRIRTLSICHLHLSSAVLIFAYEERPQPLHYGPRR